MSTSSNSTTIISAIGARNRLAKDLDELRRATAAANTLPADDNGLSFDLAVRLSEAAKSLASAVELVDTYIANAQQVERAARLARANAAAEEFNSLIFGV